MDWLQIAIECESCSLNDLSRDLSSCRYAAGSAKFQHAIAAVVKGLRRGMPVAALVGLLAAAGFTGSIWNDIVDNLKRKIDNREAIRIEEIASEIDGSLKDSLQEEELPYRELDVPVGAPVPEDDTQTDVGAIAEYIGANEGSRNGMYFDSYGHPTIGIGHLLAPDCRQLFQNLFGDAVDFDGIMNRTEELTDEQVQTLFEHDLESRLDLARRMFPRFNDFHQNVQNAIVDGIYRGDLGGSPRTRRLINDGRWGEAADEYLNHREYQTARAALDRGERPNNAGIVRRMEQNAEMFRNFGGR